MIERTISVHRFAFFARGRVDRIARAQEALRRPTDGGEPVDRPARIVARHTLDRFGDVGIGEVVRARRATRDEPGSWLVVASSPSRRAEA